MYSILLLDKFLPKFMGVISSKKYSNPYPPSLGAHCFSSLLQWSTCEAMKKPLNFEKSHQFFWRISSRGLLEKRPIAIDRFINGLPSDLKRIDAIYQKKTHYGSILIFSGALFSFVFAFARDRCPLVMLPFQFFPWIPRNIPSST